jgi:hypothetical protein
MYSGRCTHCLCVVWLWRGLCNVTTSLQHRSSVLLIMISCVYCKFLESLIVMDHVYEAFVVHVHFTVSSILNSLGDLDFCVTEELLQLR